MQNEPGRDIFANTIAEKRRAIEALLARWHLGMSVPEAMRALERRIEEMRDGDPSPSELSDLMDEMADWRALFGED